MEKKQKRAAQPAHQANVHPETQPREQRRIPDESSSKRSPDARQPDERASHDKDANEQQAGSSQGRR